MSKGLSMRKWLIGVHVSGVNVELLYSLKLHPGMLSHVILGVHLFINSTHKIINRPLLSISKLIVLYS